MFGFFGKKKDITVSVSYSHVTIEGLDTRKLFNDFYTIWGTSVLEKYMFSMVNRNTIRFQKFFGFDLLYMLQTILKTPGTSSSKRHLADVVNQLANNTYLAGLMQKVTPITDMSVVDDVVHFELKPQQREYVKHFGLMLPALNLRGYLLHGEPGTGKTVTNLVLAEALHAKSTIVVSPLNAVERVWEDSITGLLRKHKTYWKSTSGTVPEPGLDFYIVHYNQLELIANMLSLHPMEFKDTFLTLDESHNFNRGASERTKLLIDICSKPAIKWNNWSSGTPLLALGNDAIPFLKCIDPLFVPEVQERFSKIYGRAAKKANDILQHRLGYLKYYIPATDVVNISTIVEQIKIKIPNGNEFTLDTISQKMTKFIDERRKFYKEHFDEFKEDYYRAIEYYKPRLGTDKQAHAEFNKYQQYFATICKGYDPVLMKVESQYCNQYEMKEIYPTLPPQEKPLFKSARSVLKYVDLKIMGECLGTIVGKERARCHLEMVPYMELDRLIDSVEKKTLVFSSFVSVVEAADKWLKEHEYVPSMVYGDTNKNLPSIVKEFFDNDTINPLIATFQSLSTAVPLIVANQVIMTNQPFRSGIREQTIARAARLGQDKDVYVRDLLLDTGNEPNISTRTNDIMEWSQAQVASLLGISNIDTSELSLESNTSVETISTLVAEFLSSFAPEPEKCLHPLLDTSYHYGESFYQYLEQKGFTCYSIWLTNFITDVTDNWVMNLYKEGKARLYGVLVDGFVVTFMGNEGIVETLGKVKEHWKSVVTEDHASKVVGDTFEDTEAIESEHTLTEIPVNLPKYLYHGSMFSQSELIPGFKRSGKLVTWDQYEDNTWLYATTSKKESILLGISSAIEKTSSLKRYSSSVDQETIVVECEEAGFTKDKIYDLEVYCYTIATDKEQGWLSNNNPVNNIDNEYKTRETIPTADTNDPEPKGIISKERVNVRAFLHGWKIVIK